MNRKFTWSQKPVACYKDSGIGVERIINRNGVFRTSAFFDAFLNAYTQHGDIVLDVFGGSGSTLLAAEQCHRTAHLMELDPKFVDVIIERYQITTGKKAKHSDGSTFDEKKEIRNEQ